MNLVQELIDFDCHIEHIYQCSIPFTHMAVKSSSEIMNLLIDYGFDIEECDSNNLTTLHIACEQSREECVKLLIDNDVDVFECRPIDLCKEGNTYYKLLKQEMDRYT